MSKLVCSEIWPMDREKNLDIHSDKGIVSITPFNGIEITNVTPDTNLGGSLELSNVGGNGATVDLFMSPWKERQGGPVANISCEDNGNGSGHLNFCLAPELGSEGQAQVAHVMTNAGMSINRSDVPRSALDVNGQVLCSDVECAGVVDMSSQKFFNLPFRFRLVVFTVNMTSNPEFTVDLTAVCQANNVVADPRHMFNITYHVINTIAPFNVNKFEFTENNSNHYKIEYESISQRWLMTLRHDPNNAAERAVVSFYATNIPI